MSKSELKRLAVQQPAPAKRWTVRMCRFKRTANGPLELGLMIDEDQLIIDVNNKPVKVRVWAYSLLPAERGYYAILENTL